MNTAQASTYAQLKKRRGSIKQLHQKMKEIKPGISRNTIHQAFTKEISTTLRNKIVEVATGILNEADEEQK